MSKSLRDELLALLEAQYAKWDEYWRDYAEIAIYWYASNWYDGQTDPLYEVLCTSQYRPSCLCRGIEEEDELAVEMYGYILEHAKV